MLLNSMCVLESRLQSLQNKTINERVSKYIGNRPDPKIHQHHPKDHHYSEPYMRRHGISEKDRYCTKWEQIFQHRELI